MMAAGAGRPGPGTLAAAGARIRGLPRPRRRALAASVVWAVVVLSYALGYFGVASDAQTRGMLFLDGLFFLIALALPVVLFWLAALLAEEMERQRAVAAALAELATPLVGALERTRGALEAHRPASPEAIHQAVQDAVARSGRGGDTLAGPLERIAAEQARLQASLDALTMPPGATAAEPPAAAEPTPAQPRPPARRARPREPASDQPALPLMPAADAAERLDWADLVRALDFPRDAADREGFRALEAALRHRTLAQMLQAAEDVLTLLSQEGVYMEDLAVTPGDPDDWRRFIDGGRGREVAGIAGITDPGALTAARTLLRSDPIFRDTALFFQRRFDAVLGEHAAGATDAQLAELAGTRSGRAFMLLAKLSGALD